MPDFKFNGSFFFSANNKSGGQHPLLLPIINNDNFTDSNFTINKPPGIQQLVDGDLKITEKIMYPTIKPTVDVMASNPYITETIARLNNLEDKSKDSMKKFLLDQYIPKDTGMKPLEKTIITSMMESHKPLIDFLKIFLQTTSVAEDAFCRFLGTSIKIKGKKIGIDSRNPSYWDESFGYEKTMAIALKDLMEATDKGIKIMENGMSDQNPLKKSVATDAPTEKPNGDTDSPAYYVGYFDEEGTPVDPPKWVKESNKWFSKEITDRLGNTSTITAPFSSLSTHLYEGVSELRKRQQLAIDAITEEKTSIVEGIQNRMIEVQKMTNNELRKNEIDSLESEKRESLKLLDDLIDTITDVVDGTNKSGANLADDDNPSKGLNPPSVINEWIAKTRGAQMRTKYYPDQKTTVQTLVDNDGNERPPYAYMPTFPVSYNGQNFNIEVPLAFDNQIQTQKIYSTSEFFDDKQTEYHDFGNVNYSMKNTVNSLDINPANEKKPFQTNDKTHFSNDIQNDYIPDPIKNYFLPIEWEEVLEYEIQNKKTGKTVRTEVEFVPFKIDVENDYELRLIKVVNIPLLDTASSNIEGMIFPVQGGGVILRLDGDKIQFLKSNSSFNDVTIKLKVPEKKKSGGISDIASLFESSTVKTNKFTLDGRYVDENVFVKDQYFLLRKDPEFGKDNLDDDDSEIYQVKNVNRIYETSNGSITVNNSAKTFTTTASLPKYLEEFRGLANVFFKTGTNTGKEVLVYKVDGRTAYYKGNLSDTSSEFTRYQYVSSSEVEVYQEFTVNTDSSVLSSINNSAFSGSSGISSGTDGTVKPIFKATIFNIEDINYLPDSIKKGNKNIIIQGLDSGSLLSTISKRLQKKEVVNTSFRADATSDNIYTILNIGKTKTSKGLEVTSVQLDYTFPAKYNKKFYSGDVNNPFYYPVRVFIVPSNNVQGALNNVGSPIETASGTLYSNNSNIPDKLDINNPQNTKHSTDDINEENMLKEGIIYHGLDPRYVDRVKWKVFYLIEAIKLDDNGLGTINGKHNPIEFVAAGSPTGGSGNSNNGVKKGKKWYGLVDKFTAVPTLTTKMVPLIAKQLIPSAMKFIQTASNPKKIGDLLIDIGIKDEALSKFPQNFKTYSKNGFLNKEKSYSKSKPPKDFDSYDASGIDKTLSKSDKSLVYMAPQVGVQDPKPIFSMDGQAVAEFGHGAFGKKLTSFGVELKNGEFKSITKKSNNDFNKMPDNREHSVFNVILNFVKLPFEILFKIFKWILKWIKKLLVPPKIPAALAEFLSFSWLLEILGKDSIFQILGMKDATDQGFRNQMDALVNGMSGAKAQDLHDNVIKKLRGNELGFVEVLVYDILMNGKKIKQEIIERPYAGNDIGSNNLKDSSGAPVNKKTAIDTLGNPLGASPGSGAGNSGSNQCGDGIMSMLSLFPVPFISPGVSFNSCDLPIVFLKPLESVYGLMKFIQEILNAFLSMPAAILGLDPKIPIPKFGKEIPFANILGEILENLKSSVQQIHV